MNQLEKFQEMRSLTRTQKFGLLFLTPVYSVMIGLLVQPVSEIRPGIVQAIRELDFLVTNYFVMGGVETAPISAGILALMSIEIIYFMGMDMDGHTITSNYLTLGFSLFGKNLLNIWAILAGVYLYARYHKTSTRRYIYIGLYDTNLSPIVTQLMQVGSQPAIMRLFISIGVGLIIGFVLPPLSTHVHYVHKRYSLYSMRFAAGIIATVIVSAIKSFGVEAETRLIRSTGHNRMFGILLSLLFAGVIIFSVAVRGEGIMESYCRVLESYSIGGTDYPRDEGGVTTVFNMGVDGLFATFFSFVVGRDLNGPTICGIFTIVGFSPAGKHPRNIAPIMLGAYLASFTKTWEIYQPSPMLALLFSTALAPVAGEFEAVMGVIAGFLHPSVALSIGIVCGEMSLYNSGYTGGIVTIFMVPAVQSIRNRRVRAKDELSLWRKTLQRRSQDQHGSAAGQGDLEQTFAPVG